MTGAIRFYTDPNKTERRSPAFDNLLITRDLTERSARFYTEENLGRRVYTEPDIHCWVASPFSLTNLKHAPRLAACVVDAWGRKISCVVESTGHPTIRCR